MQELEKVLKEIEQRVNYYREHATFDYVDVCAGLREAEDVIRKHMNDGWISVDERLPEAEQEYVLACRRDGSMDTARYSPYSNRWYVGSMCSVSFSVIAWRPLPAPYRPERSDNHDGK